MKRILVTGAGGFLAGPLLERLKGRARVFAPLRAECDLTDARAARALVARTRPELIYHLAGAAGAPGWDGLWRTHVTATVNLLEALAESGRPVRVVVAASSAEYGTAGGAVRVRESGPFEPVSVYGACKLSQTLAALSFSRGPLEVTAAVIFNAIGPATPERLAPGAFARQIALIAAGLQDPELVTGDLGARRDYLDSRDVAAALETIARRGAAGERYNVGSGRSVPMSAIVDGLLKAARVDARRLVDPARGRPSPVKDLVADIRKISALGWKPRVPLARSLADTVAWWSAR